MNKNKVINVIDSNAADSIEIINSLIIFLLNDFEVIEKLRIKFLKISIFSNFIFFCILNYLVNNKSAYSNLPSKNSLLKLFVNLNP